MACEIYILNPVETADTLRWRLFDVQYIHQLYGDTSYRLGH